MHQVSNVIHVLFGERPKPSLREVAFGNVEYYFNKAMHSFIKINRYKTIYKTKEGKEFEKLLNEKLQTKKVVNDSWSKTDNFYWERARKLLGDDLYNEFVQLVSDLFKTQGDITKEYSIKELREQVLSRGLVNAVPPKPESNKDEENDEDTKVKFKISGFYEELVKSKKSTTLDMFFMKISGMGKASFVDYFVGRNNNSRISLNSVGNTKATVVSGITEITKISGEIIIPVTDDDVTKLNKHTGCATILDGGLVFIKGVINANEVNVSNHVKVSEISTDKY